jgi:hypothetical protein
MNKYRDVNKKCTLCKVNWSKQHWRTGKHQVNEQASKLSK